MGHTTVTQANGKSARMNARMHEYTNVRTNVQTRTNGRMGEGKKTNGRMEMEAIKRRRDEWTKRRGNDGTKGESD